MTDFINLSELHYGHEATPPINSRRSGWDNEIEALAAMIKHQGLLEALTVQQIDGVHYVANGNRRLAALRLLAERHALGEGAELPVEVKILPPLANALEVSQAMNIAHLPPHPADEYETFAALARQMPAAQIAARFGIEAKRVYRMLALGDLSPVILDAWRKDELGRRPHETIRAFTLAESTEQQEAIYHKLIKRGYIWENDVKGELGLGHGGVGHLVEFVGREAYEAAGGSIRTDLFGTDHVISDPALAKRLADEKLAAQCEKLRGKGWSWAEPVEALPHDANYSWRVDAEAGKAGTGCILSVKTDGSLDVKTYVLRPAESKRAKAAAKRSEAQQASAATPIEKEPVISSMLMQRLSEQLTLSVQETVAGSAYHALAMATAGIMANGYHGHPVRIIIAGYRPERAETSVFAEVLTRLSAMGIEDLLRAFAHAVAPAINMTVHSNERGPLDSEGTRALIDVLEPDLVNAAIRTRFDMADYVKSAPKALVLRAIEEGVNPDEARKMAGKSKVEIAEFALKNIDTKGDFGWLPLPLRTVNYNGPIALPVSQPSAELKIKPLKAKKSKPAETKPAETEPAEAEPAEAASAPARTKPAKPRKAKANVETAPAEAKQMEEVA